MRIVWRRHAVADLKALRSYIARDNPRAARQVAARIRRAVERLAERPGLGRPGRVSGTRELVVSGTPYLVPYRVKGEIVEVLRVYHGAQRWPERFEEG